MALQLAERKEHVANTKKIDIHIHTVTKKGPERLGGGYFATPEEIKPIYQRLGIRKGVILPLLQAECCTQMQSNEEAYEIVRRDPDLFAWFCNIDVRVEKNSPTTDLSRYINHYKKYGAKGIGETFFNLAFDHPMVDNLFYHSGECDMPVLIHIASQLGGRYGIYDKLGLPLLERTLSQFPRARIIAHSTCFWSHIGTDVTQETMERYLGGKVTPGRVCELMKSYQNLFCDLSAGSGQAAITRDYEFGCWFLNEYADRIYFGTDICDPTNRTILLSHWLDEAFIRGDLTQETYDKISYQNAEKLLA
jgi:predicted TIM-barrel fold metal-dependent hydrolase